MKNRTGQSGARATRQEPVFDNRLQMNVVQTAIDAGIEVPHEVGDFVETLTPPPAAGNQWGIAMGREGARLGTSQGPLEDRLIAFGRLERLADWAEETRNDELIQVDIRESRQRRQLLEQAGARASTMRIEGGLHINGATEPSTLQTIFRQPAEARREILTAIKTHGPSHVANALAENPDQFGLRRGQTLVGVPNTTRAQANLALFGTIVPHLENAAAAFTSVDRIKCGIARMTRTQPVNEALLRFDDAVTAMNRAFLHPDFAGVESDIRQHRHFDELRQHNPVAALDMAQTKADSHDPHGMWLAMAEGMAERVREDAELSATAGEHGVDPNRVLKAQLPPPRPGRGQRPNRRP